MKILKTKKSLKLYSLFGQALCACAGGIIGFVFGGPLIAIPGIFLGTVIGYIMEKMVVEAFY